MTDAPDWLARPPRAYDIVTGYFPETRSKGGSPDCRPLLVTQLLQSKATGAVSARVAYGTTKTRFPQLADADLIVQNSSDLDACGLLRPTRFVLDPAQQLILPWSTENSEPWTGCRHPRRGTLLTN